MPHSSQMFPKSLKPSVPTAFGLESAPVKFIKSQDFRCGKRLSRLPKATLDFTAKTTKAQKE